jgi:hypothetical protein
MNGKRDKNLPDSISYNGLVHHAGKERNFRLKLGKETNVID